MSIQEQKSVNAPIECEIRSFIPKDDYDRSLAYFKKNGSFIDEDEQITYYFDSKEDLRIQKNNRFSKICLKQGALHDERREELEIRCKREDFELLEKLFISLGYSIAIQWFRTRHAFVWDALMVSLDYTKGYGYIIELEKMSSEKDAEKTVAYLKEKMKELNMPLTPKKEFEEKFEYYKKNWRRLLADEISKTMA